jgi:predicted anti-sigma-YlaC factor YlaD
MNCAQVQERLADARAEPPSARVLEHLEECPGCARFADRLHMAKELLRDYHAGAEPDAGFAARVVAALPDSTSEVLGWAAIRLLPATLALALVLTLWALVVTPSPTSLVNQSADEDLWSWILSSPGGGS